MSDLTLAHQGAYLPIVERGSSVLRGIFQLEYALRGIRHEGTNGSSWTTGKRLPGGMVGVSWFRSAYNGGRKMGRHRLGEYANDSGWEFSWATGIALAFWGTHASTATGSMRSRQLLHPDLVAI